MTSQNMTHSNIISSGSEASDNEESQASSSQSTLKMARGAKTRGMKSLGRPSRSHRPSQTKRQTKHYVEHNYHDHSHDAFMPNEEGIDAVVHEEDHNEDDENTKKRRGGHRGGVAVPFPEKLHYMLSQMESNETAHIVNWQPHGRCFVVHKPKEFVEEIMPKFFRQTKMTSFQRQLNLYGFARLTAGPDRGGYYHELFLQGRLDLCNRMVRTRVKGNGSKAASSPSTEPNFYAMQPCYEQCEIQDTMAPDGKAGFESPGRGDVATKDVFQKESFLPLVEDHDEDAIMLLDGVDHDSEVVLKPADDVLVRPSRINSWNSSPQQSSALPDYNDSAFGMSKTSLPALVSPLEQPRAVVSPSRSPRKALLAPAICSVPSLHESLYSLDVEGSHQLHSGDQVFFEGLPFHYLETKDFEDNLKIVGV